MSSDPSKKNRKAWGGRFERETDPLVERFNASVLFDQKLAPFDIQGSTAHARMLARQGIITPAEAERLVAGLAAVRAKLERGELEWSLEREDVHLNIEHWLYEEVGEVAGKLHTARSRNDQVALDMHLYLREKTLDLVEMLAAVQSALLQQAEENLDVIVPGYTHLQRAQPIRLAHHLLAYAWMFERDAGRLKDSWQRLNRSPLGAGALAGTGFPIDPASVAAELGFDSTYPNSMDAVSDRDYLVELLATAALIATHLSRLGEELVLWSSEEFGWVELDDAYATGSSIMPQKKNPDIPELLRGKAGRVYGHLMALLTVLKGLPLTYNKDLQEDKEGVFDTVETLEMALPLTAALIRSLTVRRERLAATLQQDFSAATDLADFLVRQGLPFREAHEVVGRLVLHCVKAGTGLGGLSLKQYREFHPSFTQDVFDVIRPRSVVDARKSPGGTARPEVEKQLEALAPLIAASRQWVRAKQESLPAG